MLLLQISVLSYVVPVAGPQGMRKTGTTMPATYGCCAALHSGLLSPPPGTAVAVSIVLHSRTGAIPRQAMDCHRLLPPSVVCPSTMPGLIQHLSSSQRPSLPFRLALFTSHVMFRTTTPAACQYDDSGLTGRKKCPNLRFSAIFLISAQCPNSNFICISSHFPR